MLDIALFAIGYTGNQPWWIILIFVSQGFYPSFFEFVTEFIVLIYRHERGQSSSSVNSECQFFARFLMTLYCIGLVFGTTMISFVVENFDYVTLSRILSILVLLTWILMVILYIRARLLTPADTSNTKVHSAKPRMTFKKPIKPT
jgi:MFS family permease